MAIVRLGAAGVLAGASEAGYFGPKPGNYNELVRDNEYYADIAASIQKVTEEVLVNMAKHLHKTTGMKNLCMAGGVALNCVANTRILHESGFEQLYVQPAAGDGGGALGAVNVALTESDVKQIDEASSKLKLEGARLPEAALKMTGR